MWRTLALLLFAVSARLVAQDPAKVDSLLVTLSKPKAVATDVVLAALMANGLNVTDNSGSLIVADFGQTTDPVFGSTRYDRKVRALVLLVDSATTRVLITGEEVRSDVRGRTDREFKRLRIDNRAGGNGEKVWCRMVATAMMLDSTQVSEDARKSAKCAERLRKS